MADNRYRNLNWTIDINADGTIAVDQVQLAVLMDIRDQLITLNKLIGCPNFVGIPRTLGAIESNTRKMAANTRKPKKKTAKK